MPDEMDVCGSLRKIARELGEATTSGLPRGDLMQLISGSAFLINWIADGLEHELGLAAQRANELKYKQIGMGTVDYT